MMTDVAEQLVAIHDRVAAAATSADRQPGEVTLVVIGKNHPPDRLAEAIAAGASHLGENRVQEAALKKALLPPVTWHLVGPLQRNKAHEALELFDVIHSLDRAELCERLELLLAEHWPERRQPVLIEVNIGKEPQKAGVLPDSAELLVRQALECKHLDPQGLMAIPPFADDPEASRPYFIALRRLRDRLQERLGVPLPHLSMGMSQDFEIAIEEGATLVRVGTAIFGSRVAQH